MNPWYIYIRKTQAYMVLLLDTIPTAINVFCQVLTTADVLEDFKSESSNKERWCFCNRVVHGANDHEHCYRTQLMVRGVELC